MYAQPDRALSDETSGAPTAVRRVFRGRDVPPGFGPFRDMAVAFSPLSLDLAAAGTTYGGVNVSLEFDKPDAVMNMSQTKQRDHWEKSGRLAVGETMTYPALSLAFTGGVKGIDARY